MALDINGTEGTGGTEVLAGTAADAFLGINHGNARRVLIAGLRRYHLYGAGGTMTGAVATFNTVGQYHAVLFYPYGVANLDCRFLGRRYLENGAGRAYFGAFVTFRSAVASLIRHFRLHHSFKTCGRSEHFIRADRDAELATGAVGGHIAETLRTGRNYVSLP